MMVGNHSRQWNQAQQKARMSAASLGDTGIGLSLPDAQQQGQSSSQANSAMGVTMAVSLASGASARKTMVATGLRSTYIASPHSVKAAAIMSRWASELWAKNTG